MSGPEGPQDLKLQYFQPRGPFLPPVRWRQHDYGWVWALSVIVILLIVCLSALALISGLARSSRFSAHGAVQVDCTTRQAVDGAPVGLGSPVRIYQVDSGEVIAETALNDFQDLQAGADACFVSFRVDDVSTASGGYLVRIGDLPSQLVSKDALEQGILFNG